MKTSFIKNHLILLSLFVGLMLIYIYWAQMVSQKGFLFPNENLNSEIRKTIIEFRLVSKPVVEINFSEIYGNSGQFQILHPLLSLKKMSISNCKNCSEKQVEIEEIKDAFTSAIEKRRQLEFFLSGASPLPDDFFAKPPFTDQQGSSYAYLISMYPALLKDEKSWVEQHLSYFKISELKEVLEKYKIIDIKFLVLSHFSELQVESIIRGEEIILTTDYVLFKNQDRLGFSPLSYLVYSAADFRQAIKSGKFEVTSELENGSCILKIGNSCWTYNSRQTQAYFYRYSFTIILLIGLIALSFMGFYVKSLYEKNKVQLKHRLSLQVLSHEFRTPVSAMLLMIEQMSSNQNKFDTETQDLLVRLSIEVYRMQRIIEVSKTYLQTESHRIQFNNIEIPSINQWITDFVADINKEISIEVLSDDQNIFVDHFWFKFILSNIVQNAFIHGKPPVIIKLQKNRSQLKILIQDNGEAEFESIEEMTEAFVKSPRSQGMGLGLNMISFIVDQWGVRLDFSKKPTIFTLILPLEGKI